MRRKRLTHSVGAIVLLVVTRCALAVSPDVSALPPKLDDAVSRGLDYLVRQQNADGSFSAGKSVDGAPSTMPAPSLQTTALSLLSLLSSGHVPDVGRHGLSVRNAADYLLSKIPDDGYAGAIKADKGDASGMFGHGVVTLALVEVYGVENDRQRRATQRTSIQKMLAVILAAQAVPKSAVNAGGWGRTLDAKDSDLWPTGWNLLALRAARDAGFNVPKDVVDAAIAYVLKCRNPLDKGFAYQPGAPGQTGTTGVAVTGLYLLGGAAAAPTETAAAVKFLLQPAPQAVSKQFPYYSTYFTLQAALHAGEPAWSAVSKRTLDATLAAQSPDGGWPISAAPTEEPGRTFATAMAVLTLTVPYRLLPIYQQ